MLFDPAIFFNGFLGGESKSLCAASREQHPDKKAPSLAAAPPKSMLPCNGLPGQVPPLTPRKSASGKLKRLPYLRAPNLLRIHPTDVTHSEVISRSGSIPIAIQGAQRAGLPGTKRVLSLAVARFVRKRPTQPQILTFYIRCSLAE